MPNPHQPSSAFLVSVLVALSFLTVGLANPARAQEPEPEASTARGIQLYKQGYSPGAIKVLDEVVKKHPEDADAWYFLGLAFYSWGWIGSARAPFEQVIRLRPDSADAHAKLSFALILANDLEKAMATAQQAIELGDQSAEPHYALAEANLRTAASLRTAEVTLRTTAFETAITHADMALKLDPRFSLALITKSFAHYQLEHYSEAAASLEKFLSLNPDDEDAETWKAQLTKMRESEAQPPTTTTSLDAGVLNARAVTEKAHVLSKPEPQYTEAARKAAVVGTIVLRCVFSSDGAVKNLRIVQALPYGLTTNAVQAARKIRFTPATKDGKPVSMYIQLEYNFHLY